MPVFSYKAKQGPDRRVEGEMEAESEAAVLARLESMGCSPLRVREKETDRGGGRPRRLGRVGRRDVTLFSRQLASLLRAGVPILRALSIVSEQTDNRRFRKAIQAMAAAIRDGKAFSDVCADWPELFSPLYTNMARAGESAGALDDVLARLADEREKDEESRRKIQAALAYPGLILAVGAATVFVLLAFFMPRVVRLFDGFRQLPLPTRILIAITDFMGEYWHWPLLLAVLAAAIVARLSAMEKGRLFMDRLRLRIPALRHFVLEADMVRCARTLALLLDAGIPINRALLLAGDTMANTALREELETVRIGVVQQGGALADGFKASRFFPPLAANMVGVGEETGRIEETLRELATFYEKQIEYRGKWVGSLLEPILILAVGGVVGFIVAAMLLPIFEIGTGL